MCSEFAEPTSVYSDSQVKKGGEIHLKWGPGADWDDLKKLNAGYNVLNKRQGQLNDLQCACGGAGKTWSFCRKDECIKNECRLSKLYIFTKKYIWVLWFFSR